VVASDSELRSRRDATALPPVWTSDDPESFAHDVIHVRHPRLIEQVRAAHPFAPEQDSGLARLAAEMAGPVQPPDPSTVEAPAWHRWSRHYLGKRWDQLPFLWAESYFYRRLLETCGHFTPGPWFWLDPFAHLKTAELADAALADELAGLDRLTQLDPEARGDALLLAALWGNRADLGFAAHAAQPDLPVHEHLVVDDSPALWDILRTGHTGRDGRAGVCVVADNAGRELLSDLLLIDHILETDAADQVLLHVKPTPYYVSDATAADVAACLRRLAAADGYAATVAGRLHEAFRTGRVRLRTHWFYAAPFGFDAMPDDLAEEFAASTVTIVKGDLNYRRLVGDLHWPATIDSRQAIGYFPGPVAAVRTLKSEVVVGLSESTLAELNSRQPGWRTAGTHGLVQVTRRGLVA
jgi:hypothetical protein